MHHPSAVCQLWAILSAGLNSAAPEAGGGACPGLACIGGLAIAKHYPIGMKVLHSAVGAGHIGACRRGRQRATGGSAERGGGEAGPRSMCKPHGLQAVPHLRNPAAAAPTVGSLRVAWQPGHPQPQPRQLTLKDVLAAVAHLQRGRLMVNLRLRRTHSCSLALAARCLSATSTPTPHTPPPPHAHTHNRYTPSRPPGSWHPPGSARAGWRRGRPCRRARPAPRACACRALQGTQHYRV